MLAVMGATLAPPTALIPLRSRQPMPKVVNLRRARKARARAEARTEADANAARHGRSTAARRAAAREAETATRRHEGHRVERDAPEET
jgi:hypothetical protein